MELMGRVREGVVVLDDGSTIQEGTVVEVRIIGEPRDAPTLAEIFKDVAGKAVGLPADMSENHDHYLYGVSKKGQG